jgi:hypothetical protein
MFNFYTSKNAFFLKCTATTHDSHSYGDVNIAGKGLQTFGIRSVLRAFEQVRICNVPQMLCHDPGPRIFRSHQQGCPIKLPLTTHKEFEENAEDLYLAWIHKEARNSRKIMM